MKNKLLSLLLVPMVILGLFSGLVLPVSAQGVATATPAPSPTPTVVPVPANPNDVTFFQIRQTEIQLNGPFDSSSLVFGLPSNWKLTPGTTKMQLALGVSFNTNINNGAQQPGGAAPVIQGGTLTIRFNGITLGAYPLDKIGESTLPLDIPEKAYPSLRPDGRMELSFILDSGLSCYYNQQMTVFIHPSSSLTLPHTLVAPVVSLQNFPQPLYEGSVFPESALMVLPDSPTSQELQAAMTISAGLGNLTNSGLTLDITTASKLTADQQNNNALILVGKSASLPLLTSLALPLPATGGKFALDSAAPDNGVVEMIESSQPAPLPILVVSGNTDAGVVKAAQAVTTGLLRTGASQNVAVVEQVQPNPVSQTVPVDQSLADLNVSSGAAQVSLAQAVKTLRFGTSVASTSYRFFIPPGQTVSQDAYFDLVFGHSSLLNYSRSGLVVSLNGQPIGTVRLSDATAAQTNNHMQINIPASVVIPGFNRLDIRATMIPTDICVSPQLDGLWISIWPNSNLHLPLVENQIAPFSTTDLSTYPAPFVYQPTLSSTAFVLPHDSVDAWRSAIEIAGFLGNRSNGALYTPAVFYGDEISATDRAKYNLLLVGQASQLPIVADMNATLPGPFNKTGDTAVESNMQVTYNVPTDMPAGYVEFMTSPWNSNNLVIGAFGNSPQGVAWAASQLSFSANRTKMAGNFVIISGNQVITTDTRVGSQASNVIQAVAPSIISTTKVDLTPPAVAQPGWILPTIYIALGLIVIVLILALIGAWLRSRSRS